MFVYSIFILLYVSLNNGDLMFPSDLEHTLFGNITSMRDLFIKDNDEQFPDESAQDYNDTDDNLDFEIPDIFQFNKTLSETAHDLNDYNMINNMIKNMSFEYTNVTRRYDFHDYGDQMGLEDYKKELCVKINTQFVLHVRYEVGKALAQRENLRNDKRYQIGYLFNRLRRLHTEQVKLVAIAIIQNQTEYRTLYSMIRIYEKVVHLDVDMKDTINLIHAIYNDKKSFDYYSPDKGSIKKYGGGSYIPKGPKGPKIPH